MPVDRNNYIAGIPCQNEKGYYLAKWAAVPLEFANLFGYVMNPKHPAKLTEKEVCNDKVFSSLNLDYVYKWRDPIMTVWSTKGGKMEKVERLLDQKTRQEWMKSPTGCFESTFEDTPGGETYPHILYYIYQMSELGDIKDYRDDPDTFEYVRGKVVTMFYNIRDVELENKAKLLQWISIPIEERRERVRQTCGKYLDSVVNDPFEHGVY